MEKIENEGGSAFDFVLAFRERLMKESVDWREELQGVLSHLGWKRVTITKDMKEVYTIQSSSFQQTVHVEGLVALTIAMPNGLDMKVWLLEEAGVFIPLDKSLVVMVADSLFPHLQQDPTCQKSTVHQLR